MTRIIHASFFIMASAFILASALMAFPAHGKECGITSYYGAGEPLNANTANGERFNPNSLTAAHRQLPFGTIITVLDIDTGKSVNVRINDRGPAKWTGRVLDISYGAAKRLGITRRGTANICMKEKGKSAWKHKKSSTVAQLFMAKLKRLLMRHD